MAIFISHRCPKCFESVTLIQPQHKGGAFKGPAKGQCLNCMDKQEYDLTNPASKGLGEGKPRGGKSIVENTDGVFHLVADEILDVR